MSEAMKAARKAAKRSLASFDEAMSDLTTADIAWLRGLGASGNRVADEIERLRADYANVASSKELLELDLKAARAERDEAVAKEREECAEIFEAMQKDQGWVSTVAASAIIRARGRDAK